MTDKIIEVMARAMIEPHGFNPEVDPNTIWVGNIADTPETGSLAYMNRQCAQAALAALKEAGYVVVLMEPTEAMIDAGMEELDDAYRVRTIYRAMIAAPN